MAIVWEWMMSLNPVVTRRVWSDGRCGASLSNRPSSPTTRRRPQMNQTAFISFRYKSADSVYSVVKQNDDDDETYYTSASEKCVRVVRCCCCIFSFICFQFAATDQQTESHGNGSTPISIWNNDNKYPRSSLIYVCVCVKPDNRETIHNKSYSKFKNKNRWHTHTHTPVYVRFTAAATTAWEYTIRVKRLLTAQHRDFKVSSPNPLNYYQRTNSGKTNKVSSFYFIIIFFSCFDDDSQLLPLFTHTTTNLDNNKTTWHDQNVSLSIVYSRYSL